MLGIIEILWYLTWVSIRCSIAKIYSDMYEGESVGHSWCMNAIIFADNMSCINLLSQSMLMPVRWTSFNGWEIVWTWWLDLLSEVRHSLRLLIWPPSSAPLLLAIIHPSSLFIPLSLHRIAGHSDNSEWKIEIVSFYASLHIIVVIKLPLQSIIPYTCWPVYSAHI